METTQKNSFTDDEKTLAKHFKVKPEIVRLFSKLRAISLNEPAEDLSCFSDLLQNNQEQPGPEETTTEKTEEQQLGPGTTVEKMVEDWLRKQDYRTKLAVYIFSDYRCGDHGANEITDRIENEYKAEILRMAKNPDNSLSKEDTVMTGIACELFVWSKNL